VVRSQGVQDNEAGLLTRIIFWLTKRRLGRVPLGMRVRAVSQGAIPVRLKELAQLKVAMMVGCPF
jgi:hypothetical protein